MSENTLTEEEYNSTVAEMKALINGNPVDNKVVVEDQGTKPEELESNPELNLEVNPPAQLEPAIDPQDPKALLANLSEDQRNVLSAYIEKQEAEARKYQHSARSNIARYTHATRREQELNRRVQELEAKLQTPTEPKIPQSLQKLAEGGDSEVAQAIQDALAQQKAEYDARINHLLETEVRPIHQARQQDENERYRNALDTAAPDWKETLFVLDDKGDLLSQDGTLVYNPKYVDFLQTLHPSTAQVMLNPSDINDALWAYDSFKKWSEGTTNKQNVDPKLQAVADKRAKDLQTLPVTSKAPVAVSHHKSTIDSEEELKRLSRLAREAISKGNSKLYK